MSPARDPAQKTQWSDQVPLIREGPRDRAGFIEAPISPPTAPRSGIYGPMSSGLLLTSAWADAQETTVTSASLRSDKVEAIKIHHLVPRNHEVTHERLL